MSDTSSRGLPRRPTKSFIAETADNLVHGRAQTSTAGEIKGEYFDHFFVAATVGMTTMRFLKTSRHGAPPPRSKCLQHRSDCIQASARVSRFQRCSNSSVAYHHSLSPIPISFPRSWKAGMPGQNSRSLDGRAVFDATRFENDLENKIRGNFPTVINLEGIEHARGLGILRPCGDRPRSHHFRQLHQAGRPRADRTGRATSAGKCWPYRCLLRLRSWSRQYHCVGLVQRCDGR